MNVNPVDKSRQQDMHRVKEKKNNDNITFGKTP